jgi:hypothetical protein
VTSVFVGWSADAGQEGLERRVVDADEMPGAGIRPTFYVGAELAKSTDPLVLEAALPARKSRWRLECRGWCPSWLPRMSSANRLPWCG